MDDTDLVKGFIVESDFTDDVKDALISAIQLERLGRPISEYHVLAARLADRLTDED